MASIKTSISIQDGVSEAFNRMSKSIDQTVKEFEQIQTLLESGVNNAGIDKARNSQEQLNDSGEKGIGIFDRFGKTLLGVGASLLAAFSVRNIVAASDAFVSANARIDNLNDGLRTTEELQQQIFDSAQRTGTAYNDVANTIAALRARAGDVFDTNDEALVFAELLNKSFSNANATQQEISSATLQLTQALGSGALRGEELNAVFEAAPNIIQGIADELGVSIGQIRELASDGQITADVIRNSLINSADEINAEFESLPFTSGAIWNKVKNDATFAFGSILTSINELINSQQFTGFLNGVSNALYILAAIATPIFEGIAIAANFIYENWSFIAPIFVFLTAVLAGLALQWAVTAFATYGAAGAVALFNAVLAASPLVVFIIALGAIIAVFYLVIAVINHFADTSISATELVVGAFFAAGAFIANIFIALYNTVISVFTSVYNIIASVAEFLANVFSNPLQAAANLFFDFADSVLSIVNSVAKAIDTVFGSDLAKGLSNVRNTLKNFVNEEFGANAIEINRLSDEDLALKRFDITDSFQYGRNIGLGRNANNTLSKTDTGIQGILDSLDKGNSILSGVEEDTGKTAENTAITREDLKYLRDAANADAINRFAGLSINVQMQNNNTINSELDLDGLFESLAVGVEEALLTTAGGL